MKTILLLTLLFLISCGSRPKVETCNDWIPLFNGENLDGWDIKFKGHAVGENYNNTFRVEDGLLKVVYDEWDEMHGIFGHIFTKEKFSNYKIRVEYRFVGNQVKGGPMWAYRNNGIMLHSQSAQSMLLNQDFPVSIECQLLGGDSTGERSTANLCTPGLNVYMDDSLFTTHCINSRSDTYRNDIWVTVEAHVYGDSVIQHFVNGKKVLQYSHPHIGGNGVPEGYPLAPGTAIKEGHIALQAESHPTEFRKVEIQIMTD